MSGFKDFVKSPPTLVKDYDERERHYRRQLLLASKVLS